MAPLIRGTSLPYGIRRVRTGALLSVTHWGPETPQLAAWQIRWWIGRPGRPPSSWMTTSRRHGRPLPRAYTTTSLVAPRMRPPYGGNREAFARYRFRFRILASADRIELGHELFGQRFRMPVHLAPTAIQPSASGPRGCSSGDLFSMRLRSGVPTASARC